MIKLKPRTHVQPTEEHWLGEANYLSALETLQNYRRPLSLPPGAFQPDGHGARISVAKDLRL